MASTDDQQHVNPHYLDHVVTTSKTHSVEASEDIVSGNGIKLLAKGARIDGDTRERLLQHKLAKPLEDCVQVVGGVIPARFEPVAQALIEKHPLLRALCASERARPVPASLAGLSLSLPMQSLLTVYAEFKPDRLSHSVGVAMMALALARKLLPGEIERQRLLCTAGLVHDVGELYIDPAYLDTSIRLDAQAWRHIVTHPVVGHRVLLKMVGAGPVVAEAVLQHHERLDGFGYPRSISDDAFTLDGQILAVCEWLMALVESGTAPLARAGMAARLIPGEFSPALLELVEAAAGSAPDTPVPLGSATPLELAVPRITRLADTLRRFAESREWLAERTAEAGPELRKVMDIGLQRTLRIQASFSSTGLDAYSPELLLGELAVLGDAKVHTEIMTLVGEMEWRMRELERGQRLRASLLPEADAQVIYELIARVRPSPGSA
jgi:hypothetical protein